MAKHTTTDAERRGELVALVGVILQTVATVAILLLAITTNDPANPGGSTAAWVEVRHIAAGIGLWLVLWLVFNQRKHVRRETLETEALRHEREMAGAGGAIFDVGDEELMQSRRRLNWMLRWLLPGFTIVLAILLVLSAWRVGGDIGRPVTAEDAWPTLARTHVVMWFAGGLTLVLFLFSRYATGMARRAEWRLLRAGASFTLGNTLILLLFTLALGAYPTSPAPERVLSYIVRGLMVLLSIELVLNYVLDLYRPRLPNVEPRPAFDSRLLGLLSEPGAVAHSIAEAVNYQFGFEVSSTWFYKLMQRAIVPLVAFGALILIGLSAVVVVEPDQDAVVERWGRPLGVGASGDEVRVLGPGLHFKLPWPIDRAYRHPVREVQTIVLGLESHEDDGHGHEHEGEEDRPRLVLWNQEAHWGETHAELNLLVAAPLAETATEAEPDGADDPADDSSTTARPVPVSIIRAVVPINFRITDLGKYLYSYTDSREVMESVAYRELVRLASSMTLQEFMGPQRSEAISRLRQRLIEQLGPNGLDVGVTITFVGLDEMHPPHDVAEAFQAVVGARVQQETTVLQAEAEAIQTIIAAAGNQDAAARLDRAIRENREQDAVDILMNPRARPAPVGGRAAELVVNARGLRWRAESTAQAQVQQYMLELPAYLAGGELYQRMRDMDVRSRALRGVNKYVIAVEPSKAPKIRWNYQPSNESTLNLSEDESQE